MVRKVNLLRFSIIVIFSLLIFIWNIQKTSNVIEEYNNKKTAHYSNLIGNEYLVQNNTGYLQVSRIKEVINRQKRIISYETRDYEFPRGLKLQDFTLATNGSPVRSVIITTWRSGSSFLGDIINSIPGNYYHFEPLLNYGIMQIRGSPFADSALAALKDLLNCDYSGLDNYLDYGKTHEFMFWHNTRLWPNCEPNYCWNASFLNDFCKQFPFQSMKIVRLRLELAEDLLRDNLLNVKVLLLVRDPRGTLQSRKHREWCPGMPDCSDPNLLCSDMVSNYRAAADLQIKYPDRFRSIRYEELSLNPYEKVKDLFDFFGLSFHSDVKQFLDSHTKLKQGEVWSTFRDSKTAPIHWQKDLNLSEIQYIEDICEDAMRLWGYVKVTNESGFNPLTSYQIN